MSAYQIGPVETGIPLPDRCGLVLSAVQEQVLQLPVGGSFTMPSDGDKATRLQGWARTRGIHLRFQLVDRGLRFFKIWRVTSPTAPADTVAQEHKSLT